MAIPNFDYAAARRDGYSDEQILQGLKSSGSLDFDVDAALKDGHDASEILHSILPRAPAPAAAPQPTSLTDRAKDIGISALKGAIAVPEAAVGLADIATGGAVGKYLESVGFRPGEAKQILNDYYSDAQKAANQKVAEAKGFLPTVGAMLENPSTIVQTGIESLPAMGAGGAIGRGVVALAPRVGALAAGAIGEGTVGAGQQAEQIRQGTKGGNLSLGQSGTALASGIGTGAFSVVGGRIAQKLGIADIDTALVQAGAPVGSSKGVVRRLLEGAVSEGVFEELPQSIQEQIWQNAAMDKPLLDGVPENAAQGLIAGGLFGGVAGGALHGKPHAPAPESTPTAPPLQLGYSPDPFLSFPDGSVGRRSDAEAYIAGLPEAQQEAARARLFGGNDLTPQPMTAADVLQADSVDQAIAISARAVEEGSPEFQAKRNADIDAGWGQFLGERAAAWRANFDAAEEQRRASETQPLLNQVAEQNAEQATALSAAQGFGESIPNQMQAAMQEAKNQQAARKAEQLALQRATETEAAYGARNTETSAERQAQFEQASAQRQNADAINATIQAAQQETDLANSIGSDIGTPAAQPTAMQLAMQEAAARRGKATPTAVPDPVAQARDILTAAGVTGNERMAALRSIRSGQNTIEDLIDAHPPKAQEASNEPAGVRPGLRNERVAGGENITPVQPSTTAGGQIVTEPDSSGEAIPAASVRPTGESLVDAAAPSNAPALERVTGRQIDSEWNEFARQSGTLGIGRDQMPQVKAEHRGALTQFLAARGITHESTEVPAGDLLPTQREYSSKKVQQARDYQGGERSILISSDNHILDGHHQWLAKLKENEPVKVIRLDAPIRELLAEVHDFPSSQVAQGANPQGEQNATQEVSEPSRVQAEREEGSSSREGSEASGSNRVQRAEGGQEGTTKSQAEVERLRAARDTRIEAQRNKPKTDRQLADERKFARQEEEIAKAKENAEQRQSERDKPRKSESEKSGGMAAADVNKAITQLRAKWLGFTKVSTVQSIEDIPAEVRERADADAQTEGFYDPQTKAVYLIADNIASPARAAWVASHEVIAHGGLRMLKDKSVNEALNLAGGNKFIKQLADAISKDRGGIYANIATEEAIAELSAANETGDFDALQDRYGVTVPAASKNGVIGAVARVYEAVKRFLASAIGRPVPEVSDADVRALIGEQQAAVEGRGKESAPSAEPALASTAGEYEKASIATQKFESQMEEKYPGLRLNLLQNRNGDLNLSRVVVPMDAREQGTGTKFMQDLTTYADKQGQRIVLTPSSDFGGSKSRLADFYKRFGFVENKGNNKDFSTMESMYRDPQAKTLQSRAPAAPPEEVIPKWAENLTPEQQAALRKSGAIYTEETFKQKVAKLKEGALKKLQYGILDQFAPIKDQLGKIPYVMARMAKNADGTLEALMLYGRPHLDADGGMLVDTTKKGFIETMQKLNGEHDRFFSWMAGRRAEQLKKEGRENLFTDQDISALSTLNQGTMKDGASREAVYLQAQKDVAELNKSVLDIAEKSGLIDPESRKVWQSDIYVPFYRLMEEGVTGPSIKSGLVNQQSIKKLKGGTNNLGDLTQNMLMNWSTLLTASAKNRAARASLEAAKQIGAATEADEATIRKMGKAANTKAVSYMDSGVNRWHVVEDEHLLAAISALEFNGYNNTAMKVMSKFKNYLTFAVTSMPGFKVRNLIRDSISSIAVSQAGYNPLANLKNGYSLLRDEEARAQLVAGGGIYRFGTYMEGNRAENVKRLIDAGVDDGTILNTAEKMAAFTKKLWSGYQEIGDLSENLNRAALYEKLRKEGKSHLEASFEARDLMDFGLSGAWAGVRALNQVLPFFNARLQGLYKLGRGYNDDPRRMGAVVGAVALASVALMLAYKDDDDFKKRTDADRNNFWWFKVGDTAFRIPKPFEIGAAGSAIEHLTALMVDSENTNAKRFANQMGELINGQLAMNPIPQVFRPLLDVYANKDAFTGRPIENMAMQRLRPEDRYTYNTSELARLLSKSGAIVDPVSLVSGTGVKQLSPVQIDALIKGYFSGLGTMATAAVDGLLHHSVIDRGEALPATIKTFAGSFAETLPTNSSRYVDMLYSTAQDIEQSYASYRNAIKNGDIEKARQIMKDEGQQIAKYHLVESLKKNESKINQQIQRVINSKELTGEQKETQIRRLKAEQDKIARIFATRA